MYIVYCVYSILCIVYCLFYVYKDILDIFDLKIEENEHKINELTNKNDNKMIEIDYFKSYIDILKVIL